jgi:hypothetical protein
MAGATMSRGDFVEPIKHTKSAQFGILTMYREDLDQLVALFQQSCTRVTISDATNRYSSLDEMKDTIGSSVRYLDIQGTEPGLHFVLNQVEEIKGTPPTRHIFTELRTEETTDAADVLFYRVREFLAAHEKPRVRWPFAVLSIILFISLILLMKRSQEVIGGQQVLHASAGWIINAVLLFVSIVSAMWVMTYVTLARKIDSPSFWARNRETFEKQVVVSVISGIVGYLLGRFLK